VWLGKDEEVFGVTLSGGIEDGCERNVVRVQRADVWYAWEFVVDAWQFGAGACFASW
jgi:hypothetical protein